ncbi:hypothetical protein B0H11DRAFT_2209637 [Mycena galericulata]|nr:hypothetical protein B0H11DRAFT_2209637 [Mycena galericulata]
MMCASWAHTSLQSYRSAAVIVRGQARRLPALALILVPYTGGVHADSPLTCGAAPPAASSWKQSVVPVIVPQRNETTDEHARCGVARRDADDPARSAIDGAWSVAVLGDGVVRVGRDILPILRARLATTLTFAGDEIRHWSCRIVGDAKYCVYTGFSRGVLGTAGSFCPFVSLSLPLLVDWGVSAFAPRDSNPLSHACIFCLPTLKHLSRQINSGDEHMSESNFIERTRNKMDTVIPALLELNYLRKSDNKLLVLRIRQSAHRAM